MLDPEVRDPEVPVGNIRLPAQVIDYGVSDICEKSTVDSRAWVFTINNPTDDDWNRVRSLGGVYKCFAPEIGKQGTPHIQGYVHWGQDTKPRRSRMSKLLPRAALYVAKGSAEQNRTYIFGPYSKCDKYKEANPLAEEYGELPKQGKRTDLKTVAKKVHASKRLRDLQWDDDFIQVVAKYPKFIERYRQWGAEEMAGKMYEAGIFPTVHVRWGRAGAGKTREVFTMGWENVYKCCPTKDKLWFDGYDGQQHLLIDEFNGQVTPECFFQYIDIYPVQLPVKGGHVWRTCTDIWITSQSEPDTWWPWLTPDKRIALHRRLTDVKEVRTAHVPDPASPRVLHCAGDPNTTV